MEQWANKKVVIIGHGEVGGVFSRGFLRSGIPVYPVLRSMNLQAVAVELPTPDLVVVAVAEKDLQETLTNMPSQWRSCLVMLQNELLPSDWQKHALIDPTVISVWFEKKKGQDVKVLMPSPVFGKGAALIKQALEIIDIPVNIIATDDLMEEELVLKNIYILTTNIAGLVCGGSVESLWNAHNALARDVANDVMDIQESLIGKPIDRDKALKGFLEAINGDLNHQCMGRSAPVRLARAIALGDEAGLKIKKIRSIFAEYGA